jgi:nicotinamide riboside transporter PnuC
MPAEFSSYFWNASTLSATRENVETVSWPTARSDANTLRALVVGAGLCWSLVFVVIALEYELQLYADGAMFSYAVAAQDVWTFH